MFVGTSSTFETIAYTEGMADRVFTAIAVIAIAIIIVLVALMAFAH
jgi:hypothetical protein